LLREYQFKEFGGRQGIVEGAVTFFGVDVEMVFEVAEAVARQAGEYFPCQAHRAELFSGVIETETGKFFPDEVVIKSDVVGDENAVLRHLDDLFGHFKKTGCIRHHRIGYSRYLGDIPGNAALGIKQG